MQAEGRVGMRPLGRNGFVMLEEQKEGPCDQIIMQVAQGRLGPEHVNVGRLWQQPGFYYKSENS